MAKVWAEEVTVHLNCGALKGDVDQVDYEEWCGWSCGIVFKPFLWEAHTQLASCSCELQWCLWLKSLYNLRYLLCGMSYPCDLLQCRLQCKIRLWTIVKSKEAVIKIVSVGWAGDHTHMEVLSQFKGHEWAGLWKYIITICLCKICISGATPVGCNPHILQGWGGYVEVERSVSIWSLHSHPCLLVLCVFMQGGFYMQLSVPHSGWYFDNLFCTLYLHVQEH